MRILGFCTMQPPHAASRGKSYRLRRKYRCVRPLRSCHRAVRRPQLRHLGVHGVCRGADKQHRSLARLLSRCQRPADRFGRHLRHGGSGAGLGGELAVAEMMYDDVSDGAQPLDHLSCNAIPCLHSSSNPKLERTCATLRLLVCSAINCPWLSALPGCIIVTVLGSISKALSWCWMQPHSWPASVTVREQGRSHTDTWGSDSEEAASLSAPLRTSSAAPAAPDRCSDRTCVAAFQHWRPMHHLCAVHRMKG